MEQTLKKEERLNEKKLIERLFKEGKSFFQFPFKVVYLPLDVSDVYPAKVLISVSKRNFKRAVDRNHIKRQVREAYRKNKFILKQAEGSGNSGKVLVVAFIYSTPKLLPYQDIERKIIIVLQLLKQKNG